MNGLDFLNLVIGLIFIYLIYSIASSTLWEIIVSISNLRGKMLRTWIFDHFNELTSNNEKIKSWWKKILSWGETKKNEILEHPLIKGLAVKNGKKPTYISSEIFTDVLIDIIVNKNSKGSDLKIIDINSFKDSLNSSRLNPGLVRIFMQYVSGAAGSLDKVKEKIGKWYDETQERLIGSYKKKLQVWIFIIASVLVIPTNADTFKLATYLYNNPEASAAIANQVDLIVNDSAFLEKRTARIDTNIVDSIAKLEQKELIANIEKNLGSLKELNTTLNETGLPLGWENEKVQLQTWKGRIKKIGGLLLTIFAVSLGAPFWFDILSKLANLRSSGNKPKSSLEGSK